MTRIGIAGVGGLGSNCAMLLVRSGFCDFVLVDHDCIEASNLNRQNFFAGQVGLPKVQALGENLRAIVPDLRLQLEQQKLDREYAARVFSSCDVVVEAFDTPLDKVWLTELFAPSDKLYVCVSGFAGSGVAERIVTRKIHETFYIIGDMETEVSPQAPPLAPGVMIAAAKQADVIVDYFAKKKIRQVKS